MAKRAYISLRPKTKSKLDDIKAEGQSYDGLIQELIKFWKEERTGYWTRRKRAKDKTD